MHARQIGESATSTISSRGSLDSLTKAGAWDDDGLVDDLRIVRGEVKVGGEVLVTIEALA